MSRCKKKFLPLVLFVFVLLLFVFSLFVTGFNPDTLAAFGHLRLLNLHSGLVLASLGILEQSGRADLQTNTHVLQTSSAAHLCSLVLG